MARRSREEREQAALDETVHLGQFTDANALTIQERLADEGIQTWTKTTGRLARFAFAGEWGTRLYVRRGDRPRARAVAEDVAGPLP